jgi:hypothetical protein
LEGAEGFLNIETFVVMKKLDSNGKDICIFVQNGDDAILLRRKRF